nr:immunoglobulin heavy chain junction region [Mus musculus]
CARSTTVVAGDYW